MLNLRLLIQTIGVRLPITTPLGHGKFAQHRHSYWRLTSCGRLA